MNTSEKEKRKRLYIGCLILLIIIIGIIIIASYKTEKYDVSTKNIAPSYSQSEEPAIKEELKMTEKIVEHKEEEKTLEYKIVKRKDISYGVTLRMTVKVIVQVNRIPSKDQLIKIAEKIWEDENEKWEEFTVFIYLPGMDTTFMAYGIGEFRYNGLKEFTIEENALYGTKWWK